MNNGHAEHAEWVRTVLLRHEGDLVRYAQRITRDAERARDVVQETFLKLWSEDQTSLDGHLVEWLYTVCRNKSLDIRRKEQRMLVITEEGLATRASTPAAAAESNDAARKILEQLDRLPDQQQEAIRLKFQGGLSYREIAQVMNLTISHVGVLIHTGLKAIRREMQ
jgi:RNA polymerase sigma factor (sigma-70 family)